MDDILPCEIVQGSHREGPPPLPASPASAANSVGARHCQQLQQFQQLQQLQQQQPDGFNSAVAQLSLLLLFFCVCTKSKESQSISKNPPHSPSLPPPHHHQTSLRSRIPSILEERTLTARWCLLFQLVQLFGDVVNLQVETWISGIYLGGFK